MKKHYRLLVVALLAFFIAGSAKAQEVVVNGKVQDASDGTALPGVNILEKGTTNGALTNSDGDFTIKVQKSSTLVISFVGYTPQEIAVGEQTSVKISLTPDITQLSEVVVIGYGTVEKKDATGAVYAVSSKDFNKGIIASPQDLLVGKLAGVQVTSNSGAPGGASTIRIRGGSSLNASNDPLIVIDGFPVDNSKNGTDPNPGQAGVVNILSSINPNDIETFTVLKDASATAIYGSRASNGVIIITTKKGKDGKPKFTYNATVSIASPIKYYDVLSASEYKKLVTDLNEKGFSGIDATAVSHLGNSNTNWQKEIYRNAISTDHNIGVSGSYKTIPYRLSYGYTNQQGILKTTDFDRQSLNLNLNPSLLDNHLKIDISAKGSINKTNFGNTDAVGAALSFDPTQPVHASNEYGGYYTWLSTDGTPNKIATSNPVALLNQTDNRSTANRLIGNVKVEYKLPFLPDLKLNVNTGYDVTKSSGLNTSPENAAFKYNTLGSGRRNDYNAKNHSELLDLYFNYTKTIGGSKIDLTGGYSWQHFTRQNYNYDRNLNGSVISDSSRYKNENYLVSFFGRLNYTFKDKYLLTASVRDDGSSKFPNNQWGLFPSVALAWKIKSENFLMNNDLISDLKLRVSYGQTGQQDIQSNYPGLATYQIGKINAQYQFGNQFYQTLRPNAYDGNIKWETTTTLNLGLDFGFKNDKITGSLEIYQRDTKDLLNYIPISLGSNFSNFLNTNVGSMQNKGVELTLRATPISTGTLTWNAGANFTYNENKITKLTLTNDPGYTGVNASFISGGVGNYVGNYNIGFPSSAFFVYKQVYDTNGKPIEGLYVDKTGKGGDISSSDLNRYHFKKSAPNVMIGVNSRVNYKNFDFSFSGRFSLGNYNYNNNLSSRAYYGAIYNQSGFLSNVPSAINDTKFANAQYNSSYYVQNGSFFKMDNISAGYSLDKFFTSKLKARISLTAQNAFIVTKYKGIDPEVSGGVDNNIYPRPRTFLLGLNLTF